MQMHPEEEKNNASNLRFFYYESTLKLVMGKVLIISPIQKSKKIVDKYYVKEISSFLKFMAASFNMKNSIGIN